MDKPKIEFIGNIYGYGAGMDGSIFGINGVAPTVMAQGRGGG